MKASDRLQLVRSLMLRQKAVYYKTKTIIGESDSLLFTVYVDYNILRRNLRHGTVQVCMAD